MFETRLNKPCSGGNKEAYKNQSQLTKQDWRQHPGHKNNWGGQHSWKGAFKLCGGKFSKDILNGWDPTIREKIDDCSHPKRLGHDLGAMRAPQKHRST